MSTIRRSLLEVLSSIVDNRGRSCPTVDDGFPLIATNCVRNDHLYPTFENIRYIDDQTYAEWFRGHPEPGDILFVCKGSPGRVALVPDPVPFAIAQDMVSLRADSEVIDSRYLYYVLKSPTVQHDIANMHVGTMIPHFKKTDFDKLQFQIPEDLGIQRAIAEVLGALDDKIAANTKLAGTADELASNLFLESVRGVSMSEQTFVDVATISGGGTPSTKHSEYWEGDVNWATPTDVTSLTGPYLGDTMRSISEAGLQACSSSLYPAGSILMTSRATIGAFAFAEVPMAVNQGFIVVEPKDPALKFWIFHEMRSRTEEFTAMANGATFLELSRGNFKKFQVRLGEPERMREFGEKAETLHAAARNAFLENQTLAATRDALLPQLMSDKLRLEEAEPMVEASV